MGTPGPATLGMDEPEMQEIGRIIGDVLQAPDDDGVRQKAPAAASRDLMARFPPYPDVSRGATGGYLRACFARHRPGDGWRRS